MKNGCAREVEQLRRELEEHKAGKATGHTLSLIRRVRQEGYFRNFVCGCRGFRGGIRAGYIPRQRRELQLVAEADTHNEALPEASFAVAQRGSASGNLVLPGNIQAVTEAPILARAEGYLAKRVRGHRRSGQGGAIARRN